MAGAVKTPTTADVTGGVRTALRNLLDETGRGDEVAAVMIGTTHFVNAVIQRRGLNRAAALRICLPSSASLRPMVDWPEDLAAVVDDGTYLVAGGTNMTAARWPPSMKTQSPRRHGNARSRCHRRGGYGGLLAIDG